MKIKKETIPHKNQRYPTVGDYQLQPDGTWYISVSDTGNPDYDFLIGIHEEIELYLTQRAGISEEDITNFDLFFEKEREMGFVGEDDEPGFSDKAPYKKQHTIATGIEMLLAAELGVCWKTYDEKISKLGE